MSNYKKYVDAFKVAIQQDDEDVVVKLQYRDMGWDSVAHMVLMSEIENSFDIMLDTDDVIDFSSFEKGKEILKKYDVEL
ncbi:MAG: phosphopantetheine-binding protein [Peptococcales bacterium]|jgi:acyl carrier protein